jgi:hypothetical protein
LYSQKQYKAFSTETKPFRLLLLFEVGLAIFVAVQQPGAMDDVYLQLADKAKEVNMCIPLTFIIGDNQGTDGISGRAVMYNQTAHRIYCSCDAKIIQYNTIVSNCCLPLNMETIKAQVMAQNWEALYTLHQCPAWNPFFDACYGGYFGGIFTAACPVKALLCMLLKMVCFLCLMVDYSTQIPVLSLMMLFKLGPRNCPAKGLCTPPISSMHPIYYLKMALVL